MAWYGDWRPYVPVAKRRQQAKREMDALRKKGTNIEPVTIDGRKIAKTFWGEAWCDHLESFSDFANRLPRGRTYVRNGSVCHLAISRGKIVAKVAGSDLYNVTIRIKELPGTKWQAVKQRSAGQIASLLELLQGRLSDHVMEVVTHRKEGLFPLPGEISFDCDCPDWADMCKHVAAVLYGVGSRLDDKPELLFVLRGVNHEELIDADAEKAVSTVTGGGKSRRLAAGSLSDVFGIEVDTGQSTETPEKAQKKKRAARPKAAKTGGTVKGTASPKRSVAVKKKAAKKTARKKAVKKLVKKKTA